MKAGDIVTVAAPFNRLFPPSGEAVVRWVFPGGTECWVERIGAFFGDSVFDLANGPNFTASLLTATGQTDPDIVAWAGPFEVGSNLTDIKANGAEASVTLIESTVAQNAAAIRAAYMVASKLEAVMIGDYLNTLTDVQLQNAFGLTAPQVANLRTNKLTPAANTAAAIRAALGA